MTETMKAVVHDRYGGPEVLRVETVPRPVPAADEVLVRVRAAAVNRTDSGFRTATPWVNRCFSGLLRPKHRILGTEFAGEVAAIGASVTTFAVGDRVFGVNVSEFGTHAEYVCVKAARPIATMPDSMTFEEGAGLCDGVVLAVTYLRKVALGPQHRIMVYGASGSIGVAGVQLAKQMGAHVTAVCSSATVELVRSLGADAVIDYQTEDFLRSETAYDFVFDAVGKLSLRRVLPVLRRGGTYMSTDLGFMWQNPWLALMSPLLAPFVGRRRVIFPIPHYTQEKVLFARRVVETGEYRAVIDRSYPIEQVVEATTYVDTQQKTGNVVLTFGAA